MHARRVGRSTPRVIYNATARDLLDGGDSGNLGCSGSNWCGERNATIIRRMTFPRSAWLALTASLLAASCASRSISSPDMPWGNSNTSYVGELSEFDVVGTGLGHSADLPPVRLAPGDRVLLLQSGAAFPDEQLAEALGATLSVSPASGIPTGWTVKGEGLLGAARRGGYSAVIAYWGTLESSSEDTEGAAATAWIPVVGLFIPSENLRMRLRLRFVVLDTKTGAWIQVTPPPIEDRREASFAGKRRVDAEQVEALRSASCAPAASAVLAAVGIEGS